MDWRRQEPGCPNEAKLQADVAHTYTSLGTIEEEDLIKFIPPLCLQCQLMLSDSQMLFNLELIDFWLRVGNEHLLVHDVKEVESQVLSTDS